MSNFIQKLVTISAKLFIYLSICFSTNPAFSASTLTDWEEDIKQEKIEPGDSISNDIGDLPSINDSIEKDPLELISVGEDATIVNDKSANPTLFNRDLSTWPYYLLSYDTGTDPEADFLISMAKVCGMIFMIGAVILLLRYFKLRKIRAELPR